MVDADRGGPAFPPTREPLPAAMAAAPGIRPGLPAVSDGESLFLPSSDVFCSPVYPTNTGSIGIVADP